MHSVAAEIQRIGIDRGPMGGIAGRESSTLSGGTFNSVAPADC